MKEGTRKRKRLYFLGLSRAYYKEHGALPKQKARGSSPTMENHLDVQGLCTFEAR